MAGRFQSFVILAGMRTGSNFLEASLNEIDGVTSLGEVFNPNFVGRLKARELYGVTLEEREADPLTLLARLRTETPGLPGFRFFLDHDPRVLDAVLADPGCAKIVLTRDPVDSFVSLEIARETGQWMLRSEKHRKSAKIRFDAAAFAAFLAEREAFYAGLRRRLRLAGQTAFEIDYAELADVAVLNGLAAWLGVEGRLKAPSRAIARQNPPDLAAKVSNPEAVAATLAGMGRAGGGTQAEPPEAARGAAVPSYIAAARAPLLFLPIKAGPSARVEAWLAALDGVGAGGLTRAFSRASLRDWRAARPGHRSFAVLRHPLARAHAAFLHHILGTGPDDPMPIRNRLRAHYAPDLPEGPPGPDYGPGYPPGRHRAAFLGFLHFVKENLAGQTSMRTDAAWASQLAALQGFAQLQPPDRILREEGLAEGLAELAREVGLDPPPLPAGAGATGFALDTIYDETVEAAARAAYGRDYTAFGFGDWRG